MRVSKVIDMNIVPDTCPVTRVIIITENLKPVSQSLGHLHDHGKQIFGILFQTSDPSIDIVTCRIKIP